MEHGNLRETIDQKVPRDQIYLFFFKKDNTYIFVIHVPEQLNLPQSAFRVDLIVEGVANLLDGNLLAGLRVDSSTVVGTGMEFT
jgi:hypothetical protein